MNINQMIQMLQEIRQPGNPYPSASYGIGPQTLQAQLNQPVRQPQVDSEMGLLFERLDLLEKTAGDLQARLRPVLREVSPEVAQNGKAPLEVLVPLASRVREITDRIQRITEVLSSTSARLEL